MVSEYELNKALAQIQDQKKLLRQYEQDKASAEESKLKDQNEWKKLAEIKSKELEDFKSKYNKERDAVVRGKKFDALKDSAIKAGIRQEALDDLDMLDYDEKLQIEFTNTGKSSVLGVESYIEEVKSRKPHWFGGNSKSYNSTTGEVNGGAQNSGGPVNIQELIKLEKKALSSKDPKDMAAFEAAHKRYLQNGR